MSGIFEAYLSGDAGAFFDGHFARAADRVHAVRRAVRPLEPAVADAIAAQNARFFPSAARDRHVSALCDGAAAVVTGQQVGLFLGPLYTIYKAASTVCVARALAAESGHAVVPVFWLQTEDHDLAEIAECHVPSARGAPLALRLPVPSDHRISIAHGLLPDGITACVEQLRAAVTDLPHAGAHLTRLARHYRTATGWATAFAGLLAELFATEGLVLIDPRDPALARAAAPIHRRALSCAGPIADALCERVRALAAAGYDAPVHVRPGAPLSFVHPDGPEGPRYRLEPAADGFAEVGGQRMHGLDGLLATLETEPLRFSTSALLRPILQDAWLPTAAYVAGPGEVAYFAQLAPLYAAYDLRMPLVVPRARIRILEERTVRLLERLCLGPEDAQRPEEEVLATVTGRTGSAFDRAAVVRTLLVPFDQALQDVHARIAGSGPGLGGAIGKTRATVERAVAKLADKYEQARLHKDHGLVRDVRRMKQLLYPHDMPQERFYGLPYFAARYGDRTVIERVLAVITPFAASTKDLLGAHMAAPLTGDGTLEALR